ncbi:MULTISPECIES: flagellar motor switch protein FliG [Bacillus cereus group]|uniref:Flagellar motor switch protein FliG n=1 Tax=Bacillus cereus TaxID=1396 RepID=A0A9X6SS22_BACCE|nr:MULTISPECIES: flagellar motor switch protein FliG [Bacillus cereus group]MDA1674794.1 flagellar motor switch protein FliG [Bacillus cereus group sp. TH152-1LC]PDZ93997.1 flagellar motor switch protein FliG [Bacillus cereus]PGP12719.1 flagellar motor switch protein FliG [Bacillus cereus]
MNIFLTGSSALTPLDKFEIKTYLENYVAHHNIHVMCYRSLENEILSFFIENDEYASQLHLYSFQPMDSLPDSIKHSIQYLREKGSYYNSFGIEDVLIKRSVFENTWRKMLENADLVMCFYNGDKPTALIPIDIAEEQGIDAMTFELPGFDETKLDLPIEQKVKVVEKKEKQTS